VRNHGPTIVQSRSASLVAIAASRRAVRRGVQRVPATRVRGMRLSSTGSISHALVASTPHMHPFCPAATRRALFEKCGGLDVELGSVRRAWRRASMHCLYRLGTDGAVVRISSSRSLSSGNRTQRWGVAWYCVRSPRANSIKVVASARVRTVRNTIRIVASLAGAQGSISSRQVFEANGVVSELRE